MKDRSVEAYKKVTDNYSLGTTRFIHPTDQSLDDLLKEVSEVLARNPDIRTLAVDMEQLTEIDEVTLSKLGELHSKMGSELKQGVFLLDVPENVSALINKAGYALMFPQVPSGV